MSTEKGDADKKGATGSLASFHESGLKDSRPSGSSKAKGYRGGVMGKSTDGIWGTLASVSLP